MSILSQIEEDNWQGKLKVRLLNDGSTEPLYPLIKDLVESNQVEYRERVNGGLPSALNELYRWDFQDPKHSDFLTWHSADNNYLPHSLFKMSSFLSANPDLDFTFANTRLINEEGERFHHSTYRISDQMASDTSILNLNYPANLLTEFSDNFINACFLERTTCAILSSPYKVNCKGFEDYLHWMEMSLIGEGEHLGENEPLYEYRLHDESMTAQLKLEQLLIDQQNYLNSAKNHKFYTNKEIYELHENRLVNAENKKDMGSFSKEITSHVHSSHKEFQKLSSKYHNSSYEKKCFLVGSYQVPEILNRARERYLGLFGSDFENTGRVLIFMPDESKEVKEALLNFIRNNQNIGIILYSTSEGSRHLADSLFLESNLAQNLRIVDSRDTLDQTSKDIALLNSLGSCDAVISIASFYKDLTDNIDKEPNLINDFCAEACLAAGVGRVLLAPKILPEMLVGPLPHVFPWTSENKIPTDIAKLKTDLTSAHYDSILRTFSLSKIKKKQICSLILGLN